MPSLESVSPDTPSTASRLALCAVLFGCEPRATPEPVTEPAAATEAPAEPAFEPFADLPRRAGAEAADAPFVDSRADEAELWQRALAVAAEAETFFEVATEAKRAGDRAALNANGREARERFNRALDDTVAFEQEVLAVYGERDASVARIVRTRAVWFDRLRWLFVSVGR